MVNEKEVFATNDWLKMLQEQLSAFATTLPESATFSISEVYKNIPQDIYPNPAGMLAWSARFANCKIKFDLNEYSYADIKAYGEYDAFKLIAGIVVTEDNSEEYENLVRALLNSGKIEFHEMEVASIRINELHNMIAERTA
jgi:hypothetical protein